MAVFLQASANNSGTSNGSGQATIDISALSIAENDVVLLGIMQAASTANQDISASGNISGAYSEQADLYSDDTLDTNLGVYLKKQGASVDTSITVSGLSASALYAYRVLVYRGVDTTTQIDVATTTATGINSDLANASSITPVTSGAKIVAFMAAAQQSSTAWTAPSNLNNFTQQTDGAGAAPFGRIASGDADWTSGAFDPNAVGGGNNHSAESWAAATLALRPQPGGGARSFGLIF